MQPHKLCRGARLCLNELRSHLHGKDHCWIRQVKVAKNMGVDVRTVKRYYAALAAAGKIKIRRRGDGQSALVTITSAVTSAVPSETRQRPRQLADGRLVVCENVTSETPYRKPEVNLKQPTKYQAEFPVQEHREPAVAETEPSPYEKAQAESITNAVLACRFEPTPDLIAKLERKRRHYGVTGFVVASVIARAFKSVDGTSNNPQKPAWFTAVVENALKPAHCSAGETPATHRPKWTPRQIPVADVDQVNGRQRGPTRATEPECKERAQLDQVAPTDRAPRAGMAEHMLERTPAIATDRAPGLSLEDRRLLAKARMIFPFASRENLLESVTEMRTVQESASIIGPRPPQSELGSPSQVAVASRGAR